MLFIISLSFTFFNIWFPCFQPPFPPLLQDHLPILLDFFFCFSGGRIQPGVFTGSSLDPAIPVNCSSLTLNPGSFCTIPLHPAPPPLLVQRGGKAEHPCLGMPAVKGFHP